MLMPAELMSTAPRKAQHSRLAGWTYLCLLLPACSAEASLAGGGFRWAPICSDACRSGLPPAPGSGPAALAGADSLPYGKSSSTVPERGSESRMMARRLSSGVVSELPDLQQPGKPCCSSAAATRGSVCDGQTTTAYAADMPQLWQLQLQPTQLTWHSCGGSNYSLRGCSAPLAPPEST